MQHNIYLLGAGMQMPQLTRETLQILERCQRVFVLHDDHMVLDFLRQRCARVEDLLELYEGPARPRRQVYEQIADLLIDAGRREPPVAFVVHGNPMFLVSACEYILERADGAGLSAVAVPAVSSFDTILCDLGLDLGYGVQIFDVTTMVREEWLPNPRVPSLLFQLTTFMDDNVVKDTPSPVRLSRLVDWLAQVYPAHHRCVVVHSGAHLLERSTLREISLSAICLPESAELLQLADRPTLYIPAI
jgi:hypothetical protein